MTRASEVDFSTVTRECLHRNIDAALHEFPSTERALIKCWLRGLYYAGLPRFFDNEKLQPVVEVVKGPSSINRFVKNLRARFSQDELCQNAVSLLYSTLSVSQKQVVDQLVSSGVWIISLYYAVYFVGRETSAKPAAKSHHPAPPLSVPSQAALF